MRYTFRQIEYFVAAGDTLSITLASEKVHISQPAISAAISHLEAEFGIQLFIRHHAQGLSLTPEGMRFLREARSLLAHADELQGVARELSDTISGQLEVACLVTLYPLLVPELLHNFRRRFRQTQVHAVPGNQTEVFAALRQGEVSLALTYDMDLPADITIEPLAPLPPIAFVAGSHPAARRKSIALAALADEPFLLLDLPISRDYFLSLFQLAGLRPNIAGRFEHWEVIRSLVARGDGYSIGNVRPRNQASLDGRRLSYLFLDDNAPSLSIGVAEMRDSRRNKLADAFVATCRELVRADSLPGMI
jgi:DNA-binding transcriptional LysR family regulator